MRILVVVELARSRQSVCPVRPSVGRQPSAAARAYAHVRPAAQARIASVFMISA